MLALRGAGHVPAARGVRSGRRGQVGPVPARRTAPRLVVRREQKREENRLQNRAGSLPFGGRGVVSGGLARLGRLDPPHRDLGDVPWSSIRAAGRPHSV